jgi:hypothetical protein
MGIDCDGHLDVSTLFELHIIAMLVGQLVFNTEISIPTIG